MVRRRAARSDLCGLLPDELLGHILDKVRKSPGGSGLGNAKRVCKRWNRLLSADPPATKYGVGVLCGKDGANIEVYAAGGELVRLVDVGHRNGAPTKREYANRWPAAIWSNRNVVCISDHSCKNVEVYGASDLKYKHVGSIKDLIEPEGVCQSNSYMYILHADKKQSCSVLSAIDPLRKNGKPFITRTSFPSGLQAWFICAGPDNNLYCTVSKGMPSYDGTPESDYTAVAPSYLAAIFKVSVANTASGPKLLEPQWFCGAKMNELSESHIPTGEVDELLGCNGLSFAPDGHLYVASASGAVLKYQGPHHARPGEALGVFAVTEGAIPWGIAFGLRRIVGTGLGVSKATPSNLAASHRGTAEIASADDQLQMESELYLCCIDRDTGENEHGGKLWIFSCKWAGGECIGTERKRVVSLVNGDPTGIALLPY